MQRTAVTSSQIKSIGYDPATNTLEVEFTNGSVYQYADVPAETHRALMGAESIGRYFQKNVKSKFKFQRMSAAPKRGTE